MKFSVIAGALTVAAGFLTTSALAQDQGGYATYEMASLELGELRSGDFSTFVPVPTPRPVAAEEAALVPQVAPTEISRTAEGIRIVGPRFFPED